jgi:biopolymer transport protein ExbB
MHFSQAFFAGNSVVAAVLFFLIAMSFASWYIIVWKSLRLRAEHLAFKKFNKNYANIKDWPKALMNGEKLKNVDGSVEMLLAEVRKLDAILPQYENHEAKKEILTMHLLQTLDEVRFSLDRGLTVLASTGSAAPFIGLFGTVWGIYHALTDIAAQGNAGLNVVAGPMGEALIATAIGLFAAIPAVLAYNSFVRLNRLLIQNLRHVAEQMTVYISNNRSIQRR